MFPDAGWERERNCCCLAAANEDFTCTEEQECASNEDALKTAIKAAIAIASDQVASGKPFFGAEVKLEQGNELLIRYVVGVGASRLKEP